MRMRMKLAVLLVGAALIALTVRVAAHHAVGAEYDASKPVKLTGTVSKIEFTNPHARLYFDVTENGNVVTWNVELNARSILTRQGWTAKSVKIGETVTVEGIRARTGVAGVHAQSITTADGRKVFIGESEY